MARTRLVFNEKTGLFEERPVSSGLFVWGIVIVVLFSLLGAAVYFKEDLRDWLSELRSSVLRKDENHIDDGVRFFSEGGLYGIEVLGEVLCAPKYTQVRSLEYGHVLVRDGRISYLSPGGGRLVDLAADLLDYIPGDTLLVYRSSGKYGIVSRSGKIVTTARWKGVNYTVDYMHRTPMGPLLAVQANSGKWFMMDRGGRQKTAAQYLEAYWNSGEPLGRVARAAKDGTLVWGLVGEDGGEVVSCRYPFIGSYSEGLAVFTSVGSSGLQGYLGHDGSIEIGPVYRKAYPFGCGLAAVVPQETDLLGFIDKSGVVAIPPSFGVVVAKDGGELAPVFVRRSSLFGLRRTAFAPVTRSGAIGWTDRRGRFRKR